MKTIIHYAIIFMLLGLIVIHFMLSLYLFFAWSYVGFRAEYLILIGTILLPLILFRFFFYRKWQHMDIVLVTASILPMLIVSSYDLYRNHSNYSENYIWQIPTIIACILTPALIAIHFRFKDVTST